MDDWVPYTKALFLHLASMMTPVTPEALEERANCSLFVRAMLVNLHEFHAVLVGDWELRSDGNRHAHPRPPPDKMMKDLWRAAVKDASSKYLGLAVNDLTKVLELVIIDYANVEVEAPQDLPPAASPMELLQ